MLVEDELHDRQSEQIREGKRVIRFLNKAYLAVVDARADFVREDGQALVEYALILAMITIVTIAVLQALGVDVSKILDKVSTSLSSIAG
jgi:pilus assembly protein Flp/PilA